MQNTYDVVLEGGGAKGIVFVGAFQEIEARKLNIRRYVGTSAGSITAVLLAAGYNAQELFEAVNEKFIDPKTGIEKPIFLSFLDTPEKTDFSENDINTSLLCLLLSEIDIPLLPKIVENRIHQSVTYELMKLSGYREIFSLLEKGGLYSGKKFIEWLAKKLTAKNPSWATATLSEFYKSTGKDLSVVASDITANEMLVLNHRTAPDCPVVYAVRMSISLPFVWQEVIWQKSWGLYQGRDLTGNAIVDGGVLSNFPISLIVDTGHENIMGDFKANEAGTLGLLIDEKIAVSNAGQTSPIEISNQGASRLANIKVLQRISNLVDTLTSASDKAEIKAHEKLICHLPAKGYGTTEFNMSKERMQALINSGRQAMKEYLDALA